jgi:hypothetical protein
MNWRFWSRSNDQELERELRAHLDLEAGSKANSTPVVARWAISRRSRRKCAKCGDGPLLTDFGRT